MATADELKALGNKAITEKNFDEAIAKFTEAIALQSDNHILYSNRSAAYASKRDYQNALTDAEKTTQLQPDWAKGWGRKGTALHGKGDLEAAKAAFQHGLTLEAGNAQLKSGLASVEKAIEMEAAEPMGGADPFGDNMGKMFSDPALFAKLAANPKTSPFLADPEFIARLQAMQRNPSMQEAIFSDPRMIQVLGVLMGLNFDVSSGPPGSADATASKMRKEQQGTVEDDDEEMEMGGVPLPSPKAPAAPPKKAEPEPEPEDEEALAKKKAKEEAEEEKRLGTAEYKKRNFDAAIGHYSRAWDLHRDIAYLNNLGAAHFEKGEYQACIDACTKAIEEGREIYADFKMIAKSYARVGTAYERLGDLPQAIEHYHKSLTEHRTPEVLNKLRAAERGQLEATRLGYIDPAKADEAREEGNRKFKEMDWPGAVAAYTEMTKRAPDDPRGYSNRAAAFVKLLEFPSAIEDCDAAIKRDPNFIRAYIRKAQAYHGMRKYSESVDACAEAQRVDIEHHGGANAREIDQQQQKAFMAMYAARENESEDQTRERLMRDPEIMSMMQDPVMNTILQQAQNDPAALQEHMKNPNVRSKIQKLVAAGVIRVGR